MNILFSHASKCKVEENRSNFTKNFSKGLGLSKYTIFIVLHNPTKINHWLKKMKILVVIVIMLQVFFLHFFYLVTFQTEPFIQFIEVSLFWISMLRDIYSFKLIYSCDTAYAFFPTELEHKIFIDLVHNHQAT